MASSLPTSTTTSSSSSSFPQIHFSCPCGEAEPPIKRSKRLSQDHTEIDSDSDTPEEDDQPFDPYNPRAAFSLFPLDTLLFCEDCNQIKCHRCVINEIICYFCPSCLFEVPSSTVKSEGNRCTRNCYTCPICFASLTVTPLGEEQTGPFILLCPHCHWSSSDIGIEFEKPTSITAQLAAKLKAANAAAATPSVTSSLASPDTIISTPLSPLGAGSSSYFPPTTPPPLDGVEPTDDEMFTRLKNFYNNQKVATGSDDSGSLSRLMGLYSSAGRMRNYGGPLSRTSKSKTEWEEYSNVREISDDTDLISRIAATGLAGSASQTQRLEQPFHNPRLLSDLRPIASLLRTKRARRCRTCRHILYKPEPKVGSVRQRLRLVAINYVPTLQITPFDAATTDFNNLPPLTPTMFLLTLHNPLYDPMSVHLATPAGKPTIVTIFCPEFEIGANTDVWNEALENATSSRRSSTAATAGSSKSRRAPLPGTIWDHGRNWTSVVVEVIPPHEERMIVKVPILVRTVYETDVGGDDALDREVKEKREYAFWTSIDIGRIGRRGDMGMMRPQSVVVVGTDRGERERAERRERRSMR